jgi:hypothetical protein
MDTEEADYIDGLVSERHENGALKDQNHLLSRIESKGLWAYWHKDWLLEIRDLVRQQLPRSFSLFVESEAILITPSGDRKGEAISPDLSVTRPGPGSSPRARGDATAAVIDVEEGCEIFTQYSLIVRRAPDNRLVAACEILSPTNKGLYHSLEREKYQRKRALYLEAGVNLLEIDALIEGDRLLPPALTDLSAYPRRAWAALHGQGKRRLRGWGWRDDEPLPVVSWDVEEGAETLVDLPRALEQACRFNDWETLVGP